MDRDAQNKALADLDDLSAKMPIFFELARKQILRDRYSSGQRKAIKGELGIMDGTPAPYYGDPTGETAVWDEVNDKTDKAIRSAHQLILKLINMFERIQQSSIVTQETNKTSFKTSCLACGDPIDGRILSGFDERCYKKWIRLGRPDRQIFINNSRNDVTEAS